MKKINLALQSVCFIRQKVEMLNDFKQFTYQTRNRVNLYWERGNTHFVIVVVTSKVTHHIRIPLLTITTNYMYITYSWTSNFFFTKSPDCLSGWKRGWYYDLKQYCSYMKNQDIIVKTVIAILSFIWNFLITVLNLFFFFYFITKST